MRENPRSVLTWSPRAHPLRSILRVVASLFVGTGALALGARPLSRDLVFPTYRVETLSPPSDVAEWTVVARDGVAVRALEIPGPPDARVLVYFHNNRETMVHGLGLGRELSRRGFRVVLPEYRGYGLSSGAEPSEEGLYSDAEAVLDELRLRRIGTKRIVLCGVSLGTGVAAEMARRGKGSALVLIAPYTSLPDVVNAVVPAFPARLLMPDRFDTLGKSQDIHVPTLILHGDADEIIPFWMGRSLAAAIVGARFVAVSGGHHGDLFLREPETLFRAITALGSI